MAALSQRTYRNLFWLVLACVALFRLLLAGRFGLGVDESHYVMYARHPAWGYFDHPPLVAFLCALTSRLGQGIFYIRLGPILCATASLVLVRYLALALYRDERVAFWSQILLLVMPYQQLLMVALLPDATLNLSWCAALLMVWRAVQAGKWRYWILSGVFWGSALLSKYHGVLLPICLLGYLLSSPKDRAWLARPQPYAAALIGLILFVPNIIWNARHDWISYTYQLGRGSTGGVQLDRILEVFGGQFAVWSPVIFGLLIAAAIVLGRQRPLDDSDRFVLWTSVPVFVFFCVIGATSRILPHWTAAGWWTGSLLVARVTLWRLDAAGKEAVRWRRWSVAALISGILMTVLLYVGLFVPIVGPVYSLARTISSRVNDRIPAVKTLVPFEGRFDMTNDLFGWEQIAARVEAVKDAMPHPQRTFIFSHRFYTVSQLGVYLPNTTVATTLSRKFDQYKLWFRPDSHVGWDALFVDDDRYRQGPERYMPLFERVERNPVQIEVFRDGYPAHNISVYRCYGYSGRYEP
jgi:hypothetical protein